MMPNFDFSTNQPRYNFSEDAKAAILYATSLYFSCRCPVALILSWPLTTALSDIQYHHLSGRSNANPWAGIALSRKGHEYYHSLPLGHPDKRMLDKHFAEFQVWHNERLEMIHGYKLMPLFLTCREIVEPTGREASSDYPLS